MSCKLFVQTYFGDSGSGISELSVKSSEKLAEGALPDLKEVDKTGRFINTQSWAYTQWLDEWEWEREERDEEEDEPKGIGVVFSSEWDVDKYYASFVALNEALSELVRVGEYTKVTKYRRDGSEESEFIYELPKDTLKSL